MTDTMLRDARMAAMRKLRRGISLTGGCLLWAVLVIFRLDFLCTGSVCGSMDENERDRISKRFADLTALLEDAAGLAVEGQSSQRSLMLVVDDIAQIWPLLIAGVAALTSIERSISLAGTNRMK